MKTNKLIELLQKLDPTGELNVWCDGKDITEGNSMPAHYDGYNAVIEYDEESFSVHYNTKYRKVELESMSIIDVIKYDTEVNIDYTGLDEDRIQRYRTHHDKLRQKEYDFQTDFDFRSFLEFCASKAGKTGKNLDGLYSSVKTFFDKWYDVKKGFTWHVIYNLTWDSDENFSVKSRSVDERQTTQWNATINIKYVNSGLFDAWVIEEVPNKFFDQEWLGKAEKAWEKLNPFKI